MADAESPFMTTDEVARYLRVEARTVRRWVMADEIEATVLPGGQFRFDRAYIAARFGEAKPDGAA